VGLDIALHLARVGFYVLATVTRERDAEKILSLAENEKVRNNLHPVLLDVTKEDDVNRVVEQIQAEESQRLYTFFGLVHNAAVLTAGPFEALDFKAMEHLVNVNFLAPIRITHSLLSILRKNTGRVLFISSLGELVPAGFHGPYEATKRGLSGFADGLRRELAPFHVFAGVILPGMMETDMLADAIDDSKTYNSLSPEMKEVYGGYFTSDFIAYRKDYIYNLTHNVNEVSKAVTHALTSPAPRSVYYLGPHGYYLQLMRLVPDWLMDRQVFVLLWPGPFDWTWVHGVSVVVFFAYFPALFALMASFSKLVLSFF